MNTPFDEWLGYFMGQMSLFNWSSFPHWAINTQIQPLDIWNQFFICQANSIKALKLASNL